MNNYFHYNQIYNKNNFYPLYSSNSISLNQYQSSHSSNSNEQNIQRRKEIMPRFTCIECGRRYYAPRKKCRCEFCEEDKYKFILDKIKKSDIAQLERYVDNLGYCQIREDKHYKDLMG